MDKPVVVGGLVVTKFLVVFHSGLGNRSQIFLPSSFSASKGNFNLTCESVKSGALVVMRVEHNEKKWEKKKRRRRDKTHHLCCSVFC